MWERNIEVKKKIKKNKKQFSDKKKKKNCIFVEINSFIFYFFKNEVVILVLDN